MKFPDRDALMRDCTQKIDSYHRLQQNTQPWL